VQLLGVMSIGSGFQTGHRPMRLAIDEFGKSCQSYIEI